MFRFLKRSKAFNFNNVEGLGSEGFKPLGGGFSTAWQKGVSLDHSDAEGFWAIDACIDRISGDLSKMSIEIQKRGSSGIWREVENEFHDLLKKPNPFQNSVQFREWWNLSKLKFGNTYVLKVRNKFEQITALYILNPEKVKVLVSDLGEVYYSISPDKLTKIREQVVIPASEIIHDRYRPRHNPLVGISPIASAYSSGALGKKILEDAYRFFENGANLSGILVAPGRISQENSERITTRWREKYTGKNAGNIAVIGDGMKFEPIRAKSVDSQIVEQLKLSSEVVASCFHIPAFKIGLGKAPEDPERANLAYYSDCLQILIEEMESALDDGLGLPRGMRVNFDIDDLYRMDKVKIVEIQAKAVQGGLLAPNEGRKELDRAPLAGGDSIYMQQQYYSLEALAKRDAKEDPFNKTAEAPKIEAPKSEDEEKEIKSKAKIDFEGFKKRLKEVISV